MAKELSIESIKKELIDGMVNNVEILKLLEIEKYESIKLNNVLNSLIFEYDYPNGIGNYISVEVEECEYSQIGIRDRKKYTVSIKIGLDNKNNLDTMCSLVKNIIFKAYPYIRKINNETFYTKQHDGLFNNDYMTLNRLITFTIE